MYRQRREARAPRIRRSFIPLSLRPTHRARGTIVAARQIVGSLAPGRANVLGVAGFVARAEAAGLALGDRAQSG